MRSTSSQLRPTIWQGMPPRRQSLSAAREPRMTSVRTRLVGAAELEAVVPSLATILSDTVNGGTPLGFLAPLTEAAAQEYWRSLRRSLSAGNRLLLVASSERGVIGSGQLSLPAAPNGRHRAEVEKLLVAPALKGLGLGREILHALHQAGRDAGRTLFFLNTRRGSPAEGFYQRMGYRDVGLLPGWSVGPDGARRDHVIYCRELES